jgi:hypothetical protein
MSYNFCSDGNCIDAVPTEIQDITTISVTDGVYDNFTISSDVGSEYDSTIPSAWDDYTILNAGFAGHTDAGDLDASIKDIDYIAIKRRKVGTFKWTPIKEITINTASDLYFAFNDYLVTPGEYEYAFVPVMKTGSEGNYIINTINVNFSGVFICDIESIYKFFVNVQMTSTEQAQAVSTYETFGRRFPVYVSNAMTNYQKGKFSATVLNEDFMSTRTLDRDGLREMRNSFVQFLTNKRAKIIKDWNGNAWMVAISDDINITFEQNTDNALADVSFSYVEIGEVDNEEDMRLNGLVAEV